MKINDKIIITWLDYKSWVDLPKKLLEIGDIGVIIRINRDDFRAMFDNGEMSFFVDNKQNGVIQYKKYNYRLKKLERILK